MRCYREVSPELLMIQQARRASQREILPRTCRSFEQGNWSGVPLMLDAVVKMKKVSYSCITCPASLSCCM